MDITQIKDPRAFSTQLLTMPDLSAKEVTMTNWHWRIWKETKMNLGYSQRALLEEVVALDTEGHGTSKVLMGCLEALVELELEATDEA